MSSAPAPAWVRDAEAAAARPPAAPREPLFVAGAECGSVEPALAARLHAAGLPLAPAGRGWAMTGDPDAGLDAIARWLHGNRVCSGWRNEMLAVTDLADRRVARIERAAVRPLGLATRAAHLVGTTPAGEVWIQQRALDKAVDPGRWDTLVGGLVAADESTPQALERETWEEAGLAAADLRGLCAIGRVTSRRPVSDGYMVEHIEMFEAVVPDDRVPANQDGEVMRFERVVPDVLRAGLAQREFTIEATLVLLHWLRRHGALPSMLTAPAARRPRRR